MKGQRLYKKEKLCSTVAIEQLFGADPAVHRALVYPLRALWRDNPRRRSDAPAAFVISVPKRRLRHAVDRVAMRRRIRESYRLGRPLMALPDGARLDIAFVYVADRRVDYDRVRQAMHRLLTAISESQCPAPCPEQ